MKWVITIVFSIFIAFGIIWLISNYVGWPGGIWGTILTLVVLVATASVVTGIMARQYK